MTGGITIGRLFGIRIQLDFSLIFIFLLVLFNLGAGVLPSWHPDWSRTLIWSVALAAALLFFGSILVHELSHALVARRQGIPVRSITLFLFGGVANIEHEPETARAEAGMAAIGPAVSIAIGVLFVVLAGALSGRSDMTTDPEAAFAHLTPLETLLAWLGPVNIVLGVFNLLPAFPLDGGRVARALLWGITGDLKRATRWATRLSQAIAWLMIVAGIAMAFGIAVPFFGRGLVSGLWLAFIGWFLNNAARMTYRQVSIRTLLQDVPLRNLMKRAVPPAIDDATSLTSFVESHAIGSRESVFPVVARDGELLGFIDVEALRSVPRAAWPTTRVRETMTPRSAVPALDANDDGYDALRLLGHAPTDAVAIFDGGQFIGLLRHEDIARWLELQSDGEPGSRFSGASGGQSARRAY
jgi:Zn-dependent protease/CBS domain-containing protein